MVVLPPGVGGGAHFPGPVDCSSLTVIAKVWLNKKITMVFSRIIAIILAGFWVQYGIDGLAAIGLVTL